MVLNLKISTIFGAVGIVIGLCSFVFNYYMVPMTLPGYVFLTAPAMFMISFFSEETDFVPKMILFLSGQFLGYYFIGCFVQIIKKYGQEKTPSK